MAFVKKDWQYNDIITEGELNRIEQGIVEANQKADQNAADLTAHLNDFARHVTQSEKDEWNNKVSKNGDTITGTLTFPGHTGHIFIQFQHVNTSYKPWCIHKPNSNHIVFAPLKDDGTGWDWERQILFSDNYRISIGYNLGVAIIGGSDNPEGNVAAIPGSIYMRSNGSVYVKASGTGNTGWRQVQTV